MKKKKERKNEPSLDPVIYDYMDAMPPEGWIWEFVRRSNAYRERFDESSLLYRHIIKTKKYGDEFQVGALIDDFQHCLCGLGPTMV